LSQRDEPPINKTVSAVFMDTTSLSFSGEGGETLGKHGYSKAIAPT